MVEKRCHWSLRLFCLKFFLQYYSNSYLELPIEELQGKKMTRKNSRPWFLTSINSYLSSCVHLKNLSFVQQRGILNNLKWLDLYWGTIKPWHPCTRHFNYNVLKSLWKLKCSRDLEILSFRESNSLNLMKIGWSGWNLWRNDERDLNRDLEEMREE